MSCKKPKFWRADTGYEHDRGATAADVVRFEENELGNDLKVSPGKMKELERHPAKDITWVTKSKRAAERYAEDNGDSPIPWDMGCHPEIIAEDGDGGYLVLRKN